MHEGLALLSEGLEGGGEEAVVRCTVLCVLRPARLWRHLRLRGGRWGLRIDHRNVTHAHFAAQDEKPVSRS